MADRTIPAFKVLRGSVGVGTTLPSSTFHVYSDSSTNTIINLQGGSATNKGAYMNFFRGTTNVGALGTKASIIGGTSNDMMFYSASNDWIFYSTGERMRVQADGLVGIGTNAPAVELHINDASGLSAIRLTGGAASADGFQIMQGVTGVTNAGFSIYDVDATATRLVIDTNGKIGIGTGAPAVPLHVYTNSASGQEIMLQNDGSGEVGFILRTDRKSNGALTGWIGFDAHDAGDNNTRYATIEAYSTDTSGGSEDGALRFSVMAAGSDVESMTIAAKSGTSDIGWVGVGTNAPHFPLQVLGVSQTNGDAKRVVCILDSTSAAAGTGAGIALGGYTNGTASAINDFGVIQGIKENGTAGNYASAMLFSTRANGANPTERMRITSSGNVGIGTNAPAAALDLRSSDSVVAYIIRPSASPTVHIGSSTSAGAQLGYVHANDYAFYGHDAAYNAIVVKSSGSVGIGTTNPSGFFQVGSVTDSSTTAASLVHFTSATASSTVNGFSTLKLDYKSGHAPSTAGAQIMFNQGYHSGNQDYTAPVGSIRGWKTGASDNYGGGLQFLYQPDSGALGLLAGITLEGSGNVGIGTNNPGQLLEVGSDGNTDYALIGPTKVGGGMGHGNYAGFSHRDMGGTGNYALIQSSSGHTYLNSASGQNLSFRINNSDTMYMSSAALQFNDNKKLILGNNSDLQLFHDGTNSYIQNGASGGHLTISLNGGSEYSALFLKDAAVELYYNGSKKFETLNTGAKVTGTLQADVLNNAANSANIIYRSGSSTIVGNNASALVVLDTGFVGIGTASTMSSSAELLGVYSASNGHASFKSSSDSTATVYIRNVSQTANTWQPYLILADSGGNRGGLALKYSTAGLKVHGQGGIEFWTGSSFGGGTVKLTIASNGTVTQAGGAYEWYDGSGAKVGEISTLGGNNLTISGTQTNHCGLSFATNAILPATQSATNNNTVDLGASGNAFKNFYIQGSAYVRNSGGNNILWARGTGWGYSPNAYRAIQIGDATGNTTVSISYDPAGNTSGAFTGDGTELLFKNDFSFVTPNSANNGWHYCMHFKDGNIGIGVNAPTSKLHVAGDTGNSAFLAYIYNSGTQSEDNGLNVQVESSGSSCYALRVNTGGDGTTLVATGSGNVGIGYTPSNITEKFCVNGKTRLQSSGDGNNVLECIDSAGDAMFNIRQSANDCLIRGYKDGGTQTLQFHSDGESYIKGGAGGGTDLSLGGPGVTSHGTLVFNNGGGSAIGKIRAEGSDDSFYVSKLAGGGLFHFTSNNSFQFNQNVKLQTTDHVILDLSTPAGNHYTMLRLSPNGTQGSYIRAQTNGDVIFDNSGGTVRMKMSNNGFIQIGNNLPVWSGSYGGALLLKGNNSTSDRYAQLTTVDSNGSVLNTGLIVKSGDVGIGTNAPARALDVDGRILADTYGFRSDTTLRWYYFDNYSGSNFMGRGGNAFTSLYDGGTQSMVWKGNGVGIGTNNPTQTLVVAKSNSGGVGGSIRIDNLAGAAADKTQLIFSSFGNSYHRAMIQCTVESSPPYGGTLEFYTGISSGTFTEKMRVDYNGYVGIGTNNPAQLLHMEGTVVKLRMKETGSQTWDLYAAGSRWALRVNDADKLTVNNGGNVGVGTDAPTNQLHVYNATDISPSGAGAGQFAITGNGYTGFIAMDGSAMYFGHNSSGRDLRLMTNETTRLYINGSGSVSVPGSFSASSKSFLIDHPTKENKKLEYGCLEGPEFGVYHRGRAQSDTITLPDYWTALVREETITVQLTSNGSFQHLYVVSQSLTEIVIGAADGETIDCFYTVYGERADIDSLVVEKEV